MITQDDIFGITDDAAFEAAALEVFRRQAAECPPYREYLALAGVRPEEVRAAREIPFLPIEIFKTHDVYCGGTEPEAVFTSSATTGMTPSRHPMRSLALYERTFRAAFRTFYGEPGQWSLYALLPNYLRRKGSSLVYMADRQDFVELLLGNLFAVTLHAARLHYDRIFELRGVTLRQIPQCIAYAQQDFGLRIGLHGRHSQGGVPQNPVRRIRRRRDTLRIRHGRADFAGLFAGRNLFRCPPWMRVTTRDVNDPFDPHARGNAAEG